MKWSELKSAVEQRLADSLRGRIEFHVTRYGPGLSYSMRRAWITLDKEKLINFSTIEWQIEHYNLTGQIRDINKAYDFKKPKESNAYSKALKEANAIMKKKGIYSRDDFCDALETALNLSIKDAINSDNPIIKSLGIMDKRFGRRSLESIEISSDEHPMVRKFYEIRCEAEGLR